MQQLTKEELEQSLAKVLNNLKAFSQNKRKLPHDFYQKLYPAEYSEIHLSDAVRYPELHPLMVQIVEQIIEFIAYGRIGSVWIDDENQAGRYFTYALARHDKKYCQLFADCLSVQDLDHEVHQNEDIESILYKWGLCDETALILNARDDNPGQHGRELIDELLEKYGEKLETYLAGSNIESDEEVGVDEKVDWGVGYSIEIEDTRRNFLFLDWDKDSPHMMVRYQLGKMKVIKFKSPQTLLEAVENLKQHCNELHYKYTEKTGGSFVEQGIKYSKLKKEAPCDLLTLLK